MSSKNAYPSDVTRAAPFRRCAATTAAMLVTFAATSAFAAEGSSKSADTSDKASDREAAHASLGGDDDEADDEGTKKKDPALAAEPPPEEWRSTDVRELPTKRYYFVGLRYRGNVIPKFMLNMFVDGGKTIYSNTIGAEIDIRKDGFSMIPALSFTEYGTGDVLFKDKNSNDIPGNYSLVNSSMKAIYASIDLLWSAKISQTLDFEYGAGFGLGVIFGDLMNNWVYQTPTGGIEADNGKRYAACPAVGQAGSGCNPRDHRNSDVDKVGGYKESSWFSGGSKPVVFPMISIPQIGLRFKPVKEFEARLGVGFSLTGFWFGLSGNYGLEKRPRP